MGYALARIVPMCPEIGGIGNGAYKRRFGLGGFGIGITYGAKLHVGVQLLCQLGIEKPGMQKACRVYMVMYVGEWGCQTPKPLKSV